MHSLLSILSVLLFCFPTPQQCDFIQKPIVAIEMSAEGFHRDILYTVKFNYPLVGKPCEYVLEQELPAGVYVSVDQLNDLMRLGKLNVVSPSFVDVEQSAERSSAFTLLLRSTPQIRDTIKLPIHFRYHAPSDKSSFVTVDIPKPQMYISCPDFDDDLIHSRLQLDTNQNFCLSEATASMLSQAEVDADYTFELTAEECNWKAVDVAFQMQSDLSAKIPIGNEKAFPPVLYITIAISWIVSLWTVFRTRAVPQRINLKLEEQRLLQKKEQKNK